jgi:hypothetical protein
MNRAADDSGCPIFRFCPQILYFFSPAGERRSCLDGASLAAQPGDFIAQNVPVPKLNPHRTSGLFGSGGEVVIRNHHAYGTAIQHLPCMYLLNGGIFDFRGIPPALECVPQAAFDRDDINALAAGPLSHMNLLVSGMFQKLGAETLKIMTVHPVDPRHDIRFLFDVRRRGRILLQGRAAGSGASENGDRIKNRAANT